MCTSGTFITVTEAAELLETTETRILMMLKKNELQGKLEDEMWYVDKISLGLCNKPQASDIVKPGGCGTCGSGCGSGC
jgi:hypothetical protein